MVTTMNANDEEKDDDGGDDNKADTEMPRCGDEPRKDIPFF